MGRQPAGTSAVLRPFGPHWRIALAALLALLLSACRGPEDARRDLLSLLEDHATAPIFGRLGGQRAPRPPETGEPTILDRDDPRWLRIERSLRDARQSGGPPTPAEGISQLLLGDSGKAVETLRAATLAAPSANAWNDFAVALLNRSQETDDAFALLEALEALRAADRLAPRHPEIHYNRARVLTAFHARHLAAAAWRDFLALEPRGPWAERARHLLVQLETRASGQRWRRLAEALGEPHPAPTATVREAVRNHPYEAAQLCERELLFTAARQLAAGDAARATLWLLAAREIAQELATARGDHLLADEIERLLAALEASPTAAPTLARPLLHYFDGLRFYDAREYSSADAALRRAREGLTNAASPLALSAALHQEISRFYQDALDTREHLEHLLASTPPRYTELRGRMHWMLALVLSSREHFEAAANEFLRAAALVRQTSGAARAAILDLLLAENFDHRGEAARGWRHRRRALAQLPYQPDPQRRFGAWIETSQALRHGGEPTLALLFLDEAEACLVEYTPPYARVEVEIERALAWEQLGRFEVAAEHLQAAERALAWVEGSPFKTQLVAMTRLVAGILTIPENPAAAVRQIRSAQNTLEASGQRTRELSTLLALAEAQHAAADGRGYRRALVRAVENLEAVRRDADDLLESIDSFQRARRLFDQLLREALAGPNALEEGFAWAERSRAQATLDRWQAPGAAAGDQPRHATVQEVLDQLEPGVVLLEFVTVDDELVCWVFAGGTARFVRLPTPVSTLEPQIYRFRNALRRGTAEVHPLGGALYRLVLEPLGLHFEAYDHLVLVTDPQLAALPFAALVEPSSQRHLLELTSLASAPSATLFLRSRERIGRVAGPLRPLIVGIESLGSGPYAHLPSLRQAVPEATSIAALFRHARTLTGHKATVPRLREEMASANAFHFVGHGISSPRDWDASALLLPPTGPEDEGMLRVRDVLRFPVDRLRLVTLSACETSNGYHGGREGTLSLAMSFFVGGVPEVVGTRWVISDEGSAHLMERFYHHLPSSPRTAEALRRAKLDCLRSKDRSISSTANWAAFEVIGG